MSAKARLVARSFLLFGESTLWRSTGLKSAGQALLNALRSNEPDIRTIAGMLLVKAGRKAIPVLTGALDQRDLLPMILRMLGDIGTDEQEPTLKTFLQDENPDVRTAARDGLRVLTFRLGRHQA